MTKLVNRAKMTTATTGTGAITLGSAEDGYQSFADAGVVDGDVVRYVIEDGSDWEIGTGTYTASGTTLSRTVAESSNADAALNLSGGAVVYVSAVANDVAFADKLSAVVATKAGDVHFLPDGYEVSFGEIVSQQVVYDTGPSFNEIGSGVSFFQAVDDAGTYYLEADLDSATLTTVQNFYTTYVDDAQAFQLVRFASGNDTSFTINTSDGQFINFFGFSYAIYQEQREHTVDSPVDNGDGTFRVRLGLITSSASATANETPYSAGDPLGIYFDFADGPDDKLVVTFDGTVDIAATDLFTNATAGDEILLSYQEASDTYPQLRRFTYGSGLESVTSNTIKLNDDGGIDPATIGTLSSLSAYEPWPTAQNFNLDIWHSDGSQIPAFANMRTLTTDSGGAAIRMDASKLFAVPAPTFLQSNQEFISIIDPLESSQMDPTGFYSSYWDFTADANVFLGETNFNSQVTFNTKFSSLKNNVALGTDSGRYYGGSTNLSPQVEDNLTSGRQSLEFSGFGNADPDTITKNISLGFQALYDPDASSAATLNLQNNVAIGERAGANLDVGLEQNVRDSVFLGAQAGNQGGYGFQVVCLGSDSQVTDNFQVQLGNTVQQVYSQAAINVRSDARDKADVRDTVFGLDFITSLRPVDYRWDMRDDYVDLEEYEVEVTRTREVQVENPDFDPSQPEDPDYNPKTIPQIEEYTDTETRTRKVKLDKDGSKKRGRFHHGLLAQDVKAVADNLGQDFGGYQDHTINGGDDVKTLQYEQLIGPMVKAIQELSARVEELEAQLSGA